MPLYVVHDRKRRAVAKKKEHLEATEVFCCNDKFVILFTDNFLKYENVTRRGFFHLECILITNKNPFFYLV